MAQVAVTINGRGYQIACDDGQEEHLRQLASYIDRRVAELVAAMGQVGDMRLLVMVSLLIADELADANAELADIRQERESRQMAEAQMGSVAAEAIETLAGRVEEIAARLERT
ncbi:MAG: cell division protein ZapA [Alphaproteobacteria bacterium]